MERTLSAQWQFLMGLIAGWPVKLVDLALVRGWYEFISLHVMPQVSDLRMMCEANIFDLGSAIPLLICHFFIRRTFVIPLNRARIGSS